MTLFQIRITQNTFPDPACRSSQRKNIWAENNRSNRVQKNRNPHMAVFDVYSNQELFLRRGEGNNIRN